VLLVQINQIMDVHHVILDTTTLQIRALVHRVVHLAISIQV